MKIGRGETNHLFVDVDGTLLMWPAPGRPGAPTDEQRHRLIAALLAGVKEWDGMPTINRRLVESVKAWHAASGGTLVIWSMGGTPHAIAARDICDFGSERVLCIAKPDLAIDDNPHVWGKRGVLVDSPDAFKVPA